MLQTSKQSWWQTLRGSDNPFLRQAAYQAIDAILLRLETEEINAQVLERLKSLVPGQEGMPCQQQESLAEQWMCRRVQWTIHNVK